MLCERADAAVEANDLDAFYRALEAIANAGDGTPRVLANQLIDAINAGDRDEARRLTGELYDACLESGMVAGLPGGTDV